MKLLQYIRKAFNKLTNPEWFSLVNDTCFKRENLSSDEIKEILQIIEQSEVRLKRNDS